MRAYRWLLRLYPASFRDEYGAEMAAMFDRRRRRASGPLGRAALWLSTLAEIAGNAAIVHVDIVRQDIRYVARTLRRAPGFTMVAVLSLALGIGANTAIFTLINTLMLRPLPVSHPEQLVQLLSRYPGEPRLSSFSWRHYVHFRDHNRSFSDLVAVSRARFPEIGRASCRERV